MTLKTYLISTGIIIFLLIVVAIVVSGVVDTAHTLISNEIAMDQLLNEDYPYIRMELYNNIIVPVAKTLGIALWVSGGLLISVNTYKYIKNYGRKLNDE